MKFLWVSVLMATAASPALAQYPVYYSPAFNMPLQPAPSPRDGGFYWVMPDGCVYGPNYYLRPPFAPITGFNPTLVGQVAFAQTFESYLAGKTPQKGSRPGQQPPNGQQQQQLQQQQPPQPDPRNSFGVGKYTLDYSDPQSLSAFDTNSALPNGYMMPFGVNPAPGQVPANSQQAMPRYPNYPSMPPQEPPPGYRPADPRWSGSMSPAYPSGVQYANYQLTNWQGPIVPTQAIEMGPPPTRLPDYGSYGSAPNPGTMQPGMGYPPNCMQYMPCASRLPDFSGLYAQPAAAAEHSGRLLHVDRAAGVPEPALPILHAQPADSGLRAMFRRSAAPTRTGSVWPSSVDTQPA